MKKTGIASIDADTEKLEQLQARSAKAKTLVGKLFQLSVADGYAIYTVEEIKGQKIRIEHHSIHDGYQDSILGGGGWFAKKQIEPIIRRQEAFSNAMECAAKQQKSEHEKYAEIVGAAALSDLGDRADVYEVASWAWKRGCRGGVKDSRLAALGDRNLGSVNDLASLLADSGCFPAIEHLDDKVKFIMLADRFSDPIFYRNPPPPKIVVMAAIGLAFEQAVGVDPRNFDIRRAESDYLDNTFLDILKNGKKIGNVCYEPQDGSIVAVNIAFQVAKGVVKEND